MAKVNSYRDLIIWQKSMSLVTEVYALTRIFPKEELYGFNKPTSSMCCINSK